MNLDSNEKRLSIYGYFIKCLANYFDFKGRASRKEYWSFVLFCTLMFLWYLSFQYLSVVILDPCKYPPENIATLFAYVLLTPLIIPLVAVSVRRMHDLGKSGWYIILPFLCISLELFMFLPKGFFREYYWGVAIFNTSVYIFYTVFFFMKRGSRGKNKYGDNPLRIAKEINSMEENDVKTN